MEGFASSEWEAEEGSDDDVDLEPEKTMPQQFALHKGDSPAASAISSPRWFSTPANRSQISPCTGKPPAFPVTLIEPKELSKFGTD